jgi:hypothetical protein
MPIGMRFFANGLCALPWLKRFESLESLKGLPSEKRPVARASELEVNKYA